MFALPPGTSAKLVHVNIRGEFRGQDVTPQADVRLEVALPNAILDAFDPALRTCLYMPAPPAHPQAKLPELPGIDAVSDTPALRFPDLAMPVKWNAEGAGYRATIETASGTLPPLTLAGLTLKSVKLDCLDGGTVGVDFTLSTTQSPDVDTIAELARFVQRSVKLALEPPSIAEESGDLEGFPEPEEIPY
jgi:hypothetical protein